MKERSFSFWSAGLLLVAGLLTLSNCQKDVSPPPTVIQGRITEYGTDLPIAGARIYLLCYNGAFFGGSSSTLGDSIVTDAKGEFHREYPQAEVCGGSYMIIYKEGYFKRDGIGVTTGVNNVNFALDPEAWLKLVTVPDGNIDHLLVSGDFLGEAGFDVWANEGTKDMIFLNTGNRIKEIWWRPWGQFDQTIQDSIYLVGHDTTAYIIHY